MRSTLTAVRRIAAPYFNSEDKWAGRGLLAAVIAIELAVVAINVLIARWNNTFYNALQNRDFNAFTYQLGYFAVLAAAYIVLKVYQLYLNQWLQIRWRRFLTERYLGHWLSQANHYRMQLLGDAADNPDQRIAEDTQLFVDRTLALGIGLLSSVVTIGSFVVMLWMMSEEAPLHLFGRDIPIPGYLVWAALIYAAIGTVFTHLIGKPLIALNFQQQQYEANFRFNLVRVRENSEQIALSRGEAAEQTRLTARFADVVTNWLAIMRRTKKLSAFTNGYAQISLIYPYILVAPAYFAGKMELGGIMQALTAFQNVQDSMSFFVTAYRTLAEWRSDVARLDGFEHSIASAQALATRDDMVNVTHDGTGDIKMDDLAVALPTGKRLVTVPHLGFRPRERSLLTGPSGAGKSTLFRAIAGIWPFGKGRIAIPKGASMMMLPQRPYFPVGTLREAIAYPADPNAYGSAAIADAITSVGLPALAERLDEDAHWNRQLSLGEQQRLAMARVLLQRPDYLFLDEATASLDEPSEAALYDLLKQRLPDMAVISIGHRSTLRDFHPRHLRLANAGDGYQVRDAQPAATT